MTPIFYVVYFAYAADWAPRPTLMAGLALVWGLRLSWNFARKAGYQARAQPHRPARAAAARGFARLAASSAASDAALRAAQVGEEDYRWPELQRQMKAFAPRLFPVLWQLFNITFICLYQHVLLLLIALPAWVAQQSPAPLGALDGVAAALFAALLLLETVADQQQWVFQQSKRKLLPQRCVLPAGQGDGCSARPAAARVLTWRRVQAPPEGRLRARLPHARPVCLLAAPKLLRRAIHVVGLLPLRRRRQGRARRRPRCLAAACAGGARAPLAPLPGLHAVHRGHHAPEVSGCVSRRCGLHAASTCTPVRIPRSCAAAR